MSQFCPLSSLHCLYWSCKYLVNCRRWTNWPLIMVVRLCSVFYKSHWFQCCLTVGTRLRANNMNALAVFLCFLVSTIASDPEGIIWFCYFDMLTIKHWKKVIVLKLKPRPFCLYSLTLSLIECESELKWSLLASLILYSSNIREFVI